MRNEVLATENLFDYFREAVVEARSAAHVQLEEDTILYLSSLLAERARSDEQRASESTLAELHGRAANEPPARQAAAYRELGDRSLYALGYFEESLQRSVVGPDYYASMGAAAYARVAQVFERWFSDTFGPVFRELAAKFHECTRVVCEVRRLQHGDHADPISRYIESLIEGGDSASLLIAPPKLVIDG